MSKENTHRPSHIWKCFAPFAWLLSKTFTFFFFSFNNIFHSNDGSLETRPLPIKMFLGIAGRAQRLVSCSQPARWQGTCIKAAITKSTPGSASAFCTSIFSPLSWKDGWISLRSPNLGALWVSSPCLYRWCKWDWKCFDYCTLPFEKCTM